MGKLKSGKKSKAGSNFKSAQPAKPYNLFEEKIVKEKQQIFGRPQKNAKGNPGVSRAQASHKRKHTLLYEYEQQHKSNTISDRRIGEKNRFISQEDKTVARYAAVRAKHKHKQLYNLEEGSEVLTHNGMTLNEIEKFEDPRSDDEDDDDGGKLDRQFVGEGHFGGGMLSRKTNNSEGPKSYKDIISQLITDSKKRKVEKQREKESTQVLTDKLDSEWKDLLPLMTKQSKSIEESSKEATVVDKYDKVVQELRFEARGVPTDKLKTITEIAAEEAKTREILENERLQRMRGPCFANPTPIHRSADDLDDNCAMFNDVEEDEDVLLSYNEAGALVNGGTTIEEEQMTVEEEEEQVNVEEGEESSDDTEEDRFSDLKTDDSDFDEDNDEVINALPVPVKPIANTTFPKTYEAFKQTFDSLPHNKYTDKLTHFIQYAKTTPNRKDDINFLLTSALQYIQSDSANPLKKCNKLLPSIYELVQIDPETSCNTFVEMLKSIKAKKGGLSVGMLLWFKVVVRVFSVSDFRHAVATAALVTLEEMLGKTAVKVKTVKSVAGGLFLAALMLEFTWISKRYSPALIQFLTSLINCYVQPIKSPKISLIVTSNNSKNTSYPKKLDISYLTDSKTVTDEDSFKLTSLYVTLKLLQTSYNQLKTGAVLPSRCEAVQAVTQALGIVSNGKGKEMYPTDVRREMDVFLRMVKEDRESRKLEYLIVEKKRPKPMRLYEPNIQTIYDRKPRGPKGEKSERDKLMYKLKQERKGALREIRKDVTFIGGHRIRSQIKSDNERKAQVKKIFSEAAIQQSDLNSLKRKKNS